MLFALPFAAVGSGALVWSLKDVLAWQRMSAWTAVSAQVLDVELEEHDGDDSTTYETTATYRYNYSGRDYTSDRVAIGSGADNIGDFQRDLYWRLRTAQESGSPVTAYVDPANPSDAVLNRDLRWGLLVFKGMFALVFGIVGFGLLFGAVLGRNRLAASKGLEERFPNEPWRWRPEWANGRISSSTRTMAYVATVFAVLWNLISLPVLVFVPSEIADGNAIAAVALLFPLIGIGLAAWAIRSWWQIKRFKVATLTLQRVPVALGGRLKGSIRVEAEVPVSADFRLELVCCEQRVTGSGKNRQSNEHVLWQKEWRVPRHQCQISSAFTSIPVEIAVPADQPTTSTDSDGPDVSWRLDATGECPGPDFWSRFELPVFAVEGQTSRGESRAPESIPPTPDDRTLAALGIRHERLPQGGEAWTFGRGRHRGIATILMVLSVIFSGAAVLLFTTDAPIVIAIAFLAVDVLLALFAIWLLTTEYRVTLDRGILTLTRKGLLPRGPTEIPVQWLRAVRAKRGMQAGNKLYYDLEVETNDGAHTAASSLPNYDVASWLAQYWMGGARVPQT
jgi:hypothetical protein